MYSMQLEIVYLYPKGTIKNGQSRETLVTLSTQDTDILLVVDKRQRKPSAIKNGQSRERLVTLGTQDIGQRLEKTKGTIKNRQSRETLVTLGTQDTGHTVGSK